MATSVSRAGIVPFASAFDKASIQPHCRAFSASSTPSPSSEEMNLASSPSGIAHAEGNLPERFPAQSKRCRGIHDLLQRNKEWSAENLRRDPDYFKELNNQKARPQYLWIGCSDCPLLANQLLGLPPREVIVHQNLASIVAHSDMNCLAVVHYAVSSLKVQHVVVCGHYGCRGVTSAFDNKRFGLADDWLLYVKDVSRRFEDVLARVDEANKLNALCELNVIQQFSNVVESHVLQDYWADPTQPEVDVHGWCYGLSDGIIHPIVSMKRGQNLHAIVDDAVSRVEKKYRTAS